ncbi:MAG: DUF4382 domain-containing protein [Bacteroidota bacterium]|nr:DUF4382 domain-containing protein [Bacteroidota bacterium]
MKAYNDQKRSLARMSVCFVCLWITLCSLLIFTACDKQNRENTVKFYLTDAPSLQGYKAVFIDIQEVSYSLDGVGWMQLPITPGIYNLMELTNGNDTLLSKVVLNEGEHIQQMRLKLGPENKLVLSDNTIVDLDTPSGQTSGIKVNIHDSASVYSSYSVVIDFNAEKSIVRKGNSGGYLLKPVIRGFIRENTSLLFGNLLPLRVPFYVSSIHGADTMTCVSDTSRNNLFVLQGLYTGTWKVMFKDQSGNPLNSINVDIVGGFNKDLGVIDLSH